MANDVWRWSVPGTADVEQVVLEHRLIRGGYRLYLNHTSLGTLDQPTDVKPWTERHLHLADGRDAVLGIEWNEHGSNAHLFVDGVDVGDGLSLEARRSLGASASRSLRKVCSIDDRGWTRYRHVHWHRRGGHGRRDSTPDQTTAPHTIRREPGFSAATAWLGWASG